MKILKRLLFVLPILIWMLLIIRIISTQSSGTLYGQNRTEAWRIVQPVFMGSLFWIVAALLVIQTVILNLNIKYRSIIECVLLVCIICIVLLLFKNFYEFAVNYKSVVNATNPTETDLSIAANVLGYRETALSYTVLSIGAAIINTVLSFVVKNRDMD